MGEFGVVTEPSPTAVAAPFDRHCFLDEARLARFLTRQRRLREAMLGAHHFAEPVWDIMLDLFAAHVFGEEVAISSLFVAASVPQSTALRRIRRLVLDGDLIPRRDSTDRRRTFVRLSEPLLLQLGLYLRQWLIAERERLGRS